MMRRLLLTSFAGALLFSAAPRPADAQQGGPDVESMQFRAVEGPQTEDVPGGTLLVAAYGVVLALLVLYVIRLAALQAGTDRQLERLERSLAAADCASDEGEARDDATAGGGHEDGDGSG